MRDDDDDHALLAALDVRVKHLEDEVGKLEIKYTLLARFVPIEKATTGLIALVAASLVGYAMARLFGAHI